MQLSNKRPLRTSYRLSVEAEPTSRPVKLAEAAAVADGELLLAGEVQLATDAGSSSTNASAVTAEMHAWGTLSSSTAAAAGCRGKNGGWMVCIL